jgi:hypothetical protein
MPDRDKLLDLVMLAVRVRRAQIEYFGSGRSAMAFARARDLERKFDYEARTLLGNAGDVRQPGSPERNHQPRLV